MAEETEQKIDSPTVEPTEETTDNNQQAEADVQPKEESTSGAEDKTAASEPATAQRMIGAREDNAQYANAPTYSSDEAVSTVSQQLSPEQQKMMAQRAAEHEAIDHTASKWRHAAEAMAGGEATTYKYDAATGELKSEKKPLTKGQIMIGILANVLGGMGAGAGARNPAEAIGQGFQYGANQVKQRDEQARQQATDDWKRRVQTIQTNFQIHQNEMAQNKLGWDASMEDVKLGAPLYKMLTDGEAAGEFKDENGKPIKVIQKIISGSDFQKEIASDPNWSSTHSAIKIGQEWDIDPKTGKPHQNPYGDAAINMKYAIIDKQALETKVAIPPEFRKYIKGNVPEDWKVRLGFLNDLKSKISAANDSKHYAGQLTGKDKDTTSDRANKGTTESGKPFAEVQNDPNASIWDRYPNLNQLADVMSKVESGGKPDAISVRNNNPGNITNPDGSIKKFNSPEEGRAAQLALLGRLKEKYPDLTAQDLIDGGKGYAGYASTKAPGNSPESVKNYVDSINHNVPTAGFSGAAPKDMPKGLEWSEPDTSELELSAHNALKRLGGFNAFRIYPGESKSFAKSQADSGKINAEDYSSILNLMESKDGKLKGADAINEDKQIMAVAADVRKKRAEAGVAVDKKQADLDAHNKAFIKANEPIITAVGEGKLFNIAHIVGLRNEDRSVLENEISSRYPNWNPEEIGAKVDLFKDAAGAKKMTAGSFANSVNVANTSIGHIAGAISSIEQLKAKYPSEFSDTSMGSNSLQWFNKKFGNEPAWNRYRVALETGITDWQNLLNNQHALTDVVRKQTDEYMSPTSPLVNSVNGLQEMAHTAAVRIKPLNETWKTTMGADHPNLIQNETLGAIRKINNPEVSRILGEMSTGGTITGSSDGRGQGGTKVADWVKPLEAGYVRVKGPDGLPHDIKADMLDAAKKQYPTLQVVFEK